MRCIGCKWSTGVSYCDLDRREHGDLKTLAFVWENGEIDWKVPIDTLDIETQERILKCSLTNRAEVSSMQKDYDEKMNQYEYLLHQNLEEREHRTLKECNIARWLLSTREKLEDLALYKTTCVVH